MEERQFIHCVNKPQTHECDVNCHSEDNNKRLSHLTAEEVTAEEECVIFQGDSKFNPNSLAKSQYAEHAHSTASAVKFTITHVVKRLIGHVVFFMYHLFI